MYKQCDAFKWFSYLSEITSKGSHSLDPQASRVLKLERNSLEYLLHHYCGVTANKE